MGNKSAQLVIDRTVVMVIAILVIIMVAGIFIAFNPNFLYKLIPDLSPPSQTSDEVIAGGDILTASCPNGGEVVGFIEQGGDIWLGSKAERKTSLIYRKNTDGTASIVIDNSWFDKGIWFLGVRLSSADDILGTVNGKVVVIDPKYLDANNQFFVKNSESGKFLVAVDDLKLLDRASYEGRRFCKILTINRS